MREGGRCAGRTLGWAAITAGQRTLRASREIPHPLREENIWTKQPGAAEKGLAGDLKGGRAARGKERAGF